MFNIGLGAVLGALIVYTVQMFSMTEFHASGWLRLTSLIGDALLVAGVTLLFLWVLLYNPYFSLGIVMGVSWVLSLDILIDDIREFRREHVR